MPNATNSSDTSALSANLIANLEAFKNFMPEIYRRFSGHRLAGSYRIIDTASGYADVLDERTNTLLYGGQPERICRKFVSNFLEHLSDFSECPTMQIMSGYDDQLHFSYRNSIIMDIRSKIGESPKHPSRLTSIPSIIMIGSDLGYQLGMLYEHISPLHLYVIEPDTDRFFLSLCLNNYAPLLEYLQSEHLKLHFRFGDDFSTLIHDINTFYNLHPAAFPYSAYCLATTSPYANAIISRLIEQIASVSIKIGYFDDLLFSFAHGIKNLTGGIPFLPGKKDAFRKLTDRPLLLIGNGPSLDEQIPFIRENRDRFAIMACGTAYSPLCAAGIQADFYIGLERIKAVAESLDRIEDNPQFFDNTICIGTEVLHPDTFAHFKNRLMALKQNEICCLFLSENNLLPTNSNVMLLDRINPLVSNCGLVVASELGFKNIYLLGIDCASRADGTQDHSKASIYYNKNGNLNADFNHRNRPEKTFAYPGNFSENVTTVHLYLSSIRMLEECIARHKKHTRYYNCSSTGARINGAKPLKTEQIPVGRYPKFDHSKYIADFMKTGRKHEFDSEKLKSEFDPRKYRIWSGKIIQLLNAGYSERLEFMKAYNALLEDMEQGAQNGQELIYATFIYGSLAYLMLPIISFMYTFEDDAKALAEIKPYLNKVAEFVSETEEIVPRAFEYIQGDHMSFMTEYLNRHKD